VKLFVCYGTFKSRKPGGHPCRNAHEALKAAGHDPEVVKTFGCFRTDPLFPGRRKIKQVTGNYQVPTLELDDGTLVDGSESILAWAGANPAKFSTGP
jgi:Glutathione S-transferase, N-terminal domain